MPQKVRNMLEKFVGTWNWQDEMVQGTSVCRWDPAGNYVICQDEATPGGVRLFANTLIGWDGVSQDEIVMFEVGPAIHDSSRLKIVSDTVMEGEGAGVWLGNKYSDTLRWESQGADQFRTVATLKTDGSESPSTSTTVYTRVETTDDEQELIRLATTWENCLVTRDVATLDRLLAEEHTSRGGSDAEFESKEQQLAEIRSGDLKITSVVCEDFQARVYGDMGVTTGIAVYKGHYKDHDISGSYPFTDTWIKRDGRWQCVATHVSKIAEGTNEPAKAIEGLWSMQEQKINGVLEDRQNKKSLKFYQDGTFVFIHCDTSTGKIELAGGGDYTFDGTTLVETGDFLNLDEYLPYRGISFNDRVRLEGDTFHQSGDRMGSTYEMLWKRVPPK